MSEIIKNLKQSLCSVFFGHEFNIIHDKFVCRHCGKIIYRN